MPSVKFQREGTMELTLEKKIEKETYAEIDDIVRVRTGELEFYDIVKRTKVGLKVVTSDCTSFESY